MDSKASSFWLDVLRVDRFVVSHNATVGIAVCGDVSEDKVATVRGGFPKVRLMTTDGLCRLTELREKGVLTTENVKEILEDLSN